MPDLAAGGYYGGIYTLLNRGDGTFQATVTYNAGDYNTFVATADFDGDGNLDLMMPGLNCEGCPGTVQILFGTGQGMFRPPVTYSAAQTTVLFGAAADFNGDGKPDIAAGTSESFGFEYGPNGVAILLGKGDGTFQPPVNFLLGGDPNFALVGDFNGDGKPDLAFTGKDGITVLTNTTP
jgi:hypothetical protein